MPPRILVETVKTIDHEQLERQLQDEPIAAAEVHGLLCGLLCARSPRSEEIGLSEVLGKGAGADLSLRTALLEMLANARTALETPGLTLAPLLPAEDRPLRERVAGIYDWSRGFVYAIGLAQVDLDELGRAAREAVEDLIAITQLDLDGLEDDEAHEEALMEVAEFIPVAAMLVYEECAAGAP